MNLLESLDKEVCQKSTINEAGASLSSYAKIEWRAVIEDLIRRIERSNMLDRINLDRYGLSIDRTMSGTRGDHVAIEFETGSPLRHTIVCGILTDKVNAMNVNTRKTATELITLTTPLSKSADTIVKLANKVQ